MAASGAAQGPDGEGLRQWAQKAISGQDVKAGEELATARRLLEWMVFPHSADEFMEEYYEKKPLLLQNRGANWFEGLLSIANVREMIEEPASRPEMRPMEWAWDLDAARYNPETKRRSTLNTEQPHAGHPQVGGATHVVGGAGSRDPKAELVDPAWAWRKFESEGCSLRLLCPQERRPCVWRLLSHLEDLLGCYVGANTYLTPAKSQGFAPHFDDIEAFILQTEGRKRWRVYPVVRPEDVLPRHSSRDFMPEELPEPILDVVLEPGDLLYMPRGVIHQGVSLDDSPSLHITVSSGLHMNWKDLLALALPAALDAAADEDPTLRASVPTLFQEAVGVMRSDLDEEEGEGEVGGEGSVAATAAAAAAGDPFAAAASEFSALAGGPTSKRQRQEVVPMGRHPTGSSPHFRSSAWRRSLRGPVVRAAHEMVAQVMQYVSVDSAADQLRRKFIRERLPPVAAQPVQAPTSPPQPTARLRLAHPAVMHMCIQGGSAVVYSAAFNACRFREATERSLELPVELAPAVEHLVEAYPDATAAADLPTMAPEEDEDEEIDMWASLQAALFELMKLGVVVSV